MKLLIPLKIGAVLGAITLVAPVAAPHPARAQTAANAKTPLAPHVLRQADGKRIADLKLSVDGKMAVLTSTATGEDKVVVYDLKARRFLRKFKGGMGAFELALSPDAGAESGRVASSTIDFWVSINDIADGTQRAHFFLQAVGGATSLRWSPDGKMLATASSNQVALFDPNSDSPDANILARHEGPIGVAPAAVAFSPDGTQLVAGWSDRALAIYDAANYDKPRFDYQKPQLREVGQLSGHEGAVTTLAWSPDGKTLASGDDSGGVRLWNYAACESLAAWTAGDSAVQSLAWSPDGESVAVATQNLEGEAAVTLWDVKTGKARQIWKHPQPVSHVVFADDGKSLLVADVQGAVMLVPVAALSAFQAVAPTPVDLTQPYLKLDGNLEISALDWSHDGRLLASAGQTQLTVRDLKTGERVRVPQTHKQPLTGVSFAPDDKRLATSSYGGIEVADVIERKVLWQSARRGVIAGWSSDGATLYVAQGSQKSARILALDARSGKEQKVIGALTGTFYNSPIMAQLSPDKSRVAVAIYDKDYGRLSKSELQVFDIASAQKLWSAPLLGRCDALAWSVDGKTLVAKAGEYADAHPETDEYVAGKMGLKWFDAATGKLDEARTRLDLTNEVEALAFAPDGQTLVVTFARGLPQLWDNTGQLKRELEPSTTNLVALAFSPDGKHLAAAGKGAPLQFWSRPQGF